MVEVYKTNVTALTDAREIIAVLKLHFPETRINFDLDDCDKILRVEGPEIPTEMIAELVSQKGFACKALEG